MWLGGEAMAKDKQYYFSHDVNASSDPKIIAMEMEFGVISYAWWWKIIEKLAVSEDYKLPLKKYTFIALANDFKIEKDDILTKLNGCSTRVQTNLTPNEFVRLFIFCLIDDFELLESDDEYFWSPSLTKRMELKYSNDKKISEQRRLAGIASGEARRKKKQNRTGVEQNRTGVEQSELKKRKEKKIYIEEEERGGATVISNSDDRPKLQTEWPNKKAYDLYIRRIGAMPPVIKERLDDLVELYQMDAVIVAINTSADNGGNSIGYVERVAADNLKKEVQKANGGNRRSGGNRTAKEKTDGSDINWAEEPDHL